MNLTVYHIATLNFGFGGALDRSGTPDEAQGFVSSEDILC